MIIWGNVSDWKIFINSLLIIKIKICIYTYIHMKTYKKFVEKPCKKNRVKKNRVKGELDAHWLWNICSL